MTENRIYHIAQPADLQAGKDSGQYECASLSTEGFIHCCMAEQLAGVVERYYAKQTGLLLLEIDPAKLGSGLVYENTVGGDELFPHIYGVIAMDAVVDSGLLEDRIGVD